MSALTVDPVTPDGNTPTQCALAFPLAQLEALAGLAIVLLLSLTQFIGPSLLIPTSQSLAQVLRTLSPPGLQTSTSDRDSNPLSPNTRSALKAKGAICWQ